MPDQDENPTTRRIMLGGQLRRLREGSSITRADAGYHIRGSDSKISRMELGRVSLKERDVEDLLTLYGVTDKTQRDELLGLLHESHAPTWWSHYSGMLPTWFQNYLSMEQSADIIDSYESMFLPGLLQTEDYARALVKGGLPDETAATQQQWIDLRMQRQAILTEQRTEFHVVIDESSLYRLVDDPSIARRQLEHLVHMAELPNVTVQVFPLRLDIWAAHAGAFMYLRYSADDVRNVVALEHLVGTLFVDKPHEVAEYEQVFGRLTEAAWSPADSVEVILRRARSLA